MMLALCAYAAGAEIVSHPRILKARVIEVPAGTAKPIINRLDEIDVYKLAPSASLLKTGHMLSLELYAGIKTSADVQNYVEEIKAASRHTGLSTALIAAIIMTESGFDPQAKSRAGAKGLMQLMPATMLDFKVEDPYDAQANINAGAAYFKTQLAEFKSLDLALAAYNAGPANVKKYGKVPPFPETLNFIKKVRAYFQEYAAAGIEESMP